jgi:hypothetical protein
LTAIASHFNQAKRIWTGGERVQILSCKDADDVYQKYHDMEYHFSKVCAYVKALKALAESYEQFCESNTIKLRASFEEMREEVKRVLDADPSYHQTHCKKMDY